MLPSPGGRQKEAPLGLILKVTHLGSCSLSIAFTTARESASVYLRETPHVSALTNTTKKAHTFHTVKPYDSSERRRRGDCSRMAPGQTFPGYVKGQELNLTPTRKEKPRYSSRIAPRLSPSERLRAAKRVVKVFARSLREIRSGRRLGAFLRVLSRLYTEGHSRCGFSFLGAIKEYIYVYL